MEIPKNSFFLLTIFTKLEVIGGWFARTNKKRARVFSVSKFRRFYYFKRRSASLQLFEQFVHREFFEMPLFMQ